MPLEAPLTPSRRTSELQQGDSTGSGLSCHYVTARQSLGQSLTRSRADERVSSVAVGHYCVTEP
jgi:hypothetical protein